MVKKSRACREIRTCSLFITLWPMIGMPHSLAQTIAVDVRNRMIYRIARFDHINIYNFPYCSEQQLAPLWRLPRKRMPWPQREIVPPTIRFQ